MRQGRGRTRAAAKPRASATLARLLATSALAGAPFSAFAAPADEDPFAVSTLRRAGPVPVETITAGRYREPAYKPQHSGAATIVKTADPKTALAFAPLSEGAYAEALRNRQLSRDSLRDPLIVANNAQPAGAASPFRRLDENEDEVLFEADLVWREFDDGPIVAEGDVQAYFGDRFLRADRLVYDPQTDIVVAEGNVAITDATTDTAFAGRVELSGDLRDGIAENFSALLAENARLAADHAISEQGARMRLSHAVYTACNVCKETGEAKIPTWRVKSLRVTRDLERRVVRFHHAYFEIKGFPVLYAPFLQAPDPSVERQSGFLTPVIGASSRLGFNVELPYYFAISHHQDATLIPKYTSADGVLWQGEYRRRDESGYHVIQGGVINFESAGVDEDGNPATGVPGVRWHFFGAGYRDFGDYWRTGYDIERVSDSTYLRRYNVVRRGDLRRELDTTTANRLRSSLFVQRADGVSEFRADAYVFQGLRQADVSSLTPYVLPLMNFRYNLQSPVAGGKVHFNANLAALQRQSGADSRRFTASAFWERESITRGGHRFNAFAELRADGWQYSDLDQGTEFLPPSAIDRTNYEARFAPTVGVEWSFPLMKQTSGARFVIEPRVQLLASPARATPAGVINEDSQSTEFDYAGLFEYNKATGFDAFEDGQRVNFGIHASAVFDSGVSVEAAVGQQFRAQETTAFRPASGLGRESSDIVGALTVSYKNIASIENRFRIDSRSGDLARMESLGRLRLWRFNGTVSYVRLDEEDSALEQRRREELTGTLRVMLTQRWSTGARWREDLFEGRTISQDFFIGYADECTSLDIIYRRDQTRDVGLQTDNAFLIRFTLRSLVD